MTPSYIFALDFQLDMVFCMSWINFVFESLFRVLKLFRIHFLLKKLDFCSTRHLLFVVLLAMFI